MNFVNCSKNGYSAEVAHTKSLIVVAFFAIETISLSEVVFVVVAEYVYLGYRLTK